MLGRSQLAEHVAPLLTLLADPAAAGTLPLEKWDLLIRVSRNARLAAALCARLRAEYQFDSIPEQPAAHLVSEEAIANYQVQMVKVELRHIEHVLGALAVPVVLLKGA